MLLPREIGCANFDLGGLFDFPLRRQVYFPRERMSAVVSDMTGRFPVAWCLRVLFGGLRNFSVSPTIVSPHEHCPLHVGTCDFKVFLCKHHELGIF